MESISIIKNVFHFISARCEAWEFVAVGVAVPEGGAEKSMFTTARTDEKI